MLKVVVDPGHGGTDTGAVREGLVEKGLSLDLARRIRPHLSSDMELHVTRRDDSDLEPPARLAVVSAANAGMLVSIHTTTRQRHGGSPGVQVHYAVGSELGRRLALILHDHLTRIAGVPGRGVQPRYHWLLRSCSVPAAWVEIGSLNHPDDVKRLERPEHLELLAAAIAKGIEAFARKRLWEEQSLPVGPDGTPVETASNGDAEQAQRSATTWSVGAYDDGWAEKAIRQVTWWWYRTQPNGGAEDESDALQQQPESESHMESPEELRLAPAEAVEAVPEAVLEAVPEAEPEARSEAGPEADSKADPHPGTRLDADEAYDPDRAPQATHLPDDLMVPDALSDLLTPALAIPGLVARAQRVAKRRRFTSAVAKNGHRTAQH